MKDILVRFLQSSHIDPVFFVTFVLDVAAYYLSKKLKKGISDLQRALYWAVILVAMAFTFASFAKVFGIIKDWNELRPIWQALRGLW